MKRVLMAMMFLLAMAPGVEAHQRLRSSRDVFYSPLALHGEWISYEPGLYVWRPLLIRDGWRPYTIGRWVWTDDGWYWVSGEPWGWATYHYGRWFYDDYYGWVWIPGNEWAPAWVEWRYGGGCVGWAPLGPYAVFTFDAGIHYRQRWNTPSFYWSFVDCRDMTTDNIQKHLRRNERDSRDFGRTRSIGTVRSTGGRITGGGPDPRELERSDGVRVRKSEITDVETRGVDRLVRSGADRHRVEVYRPRIDSNVPAREMDVKKRSSRQSQKGSSETKRFEQDPGEQKRGDSQKPGGKELREQELKRQPREIDRVHPPVVRPNPGPEPKEKNSRDSGENKERSGGRLNVSERRPVR